MDYVDSECTMACLEKASGALIEYFCNRVGEILDNQSRMQEFCQDGTNGEWCHIPGWYNATYQATRMDSTDSVSSSSTWQKGSKYLYEPVESWPIDRSFAARKEACNHDEEILKRYRGPVLTWD